MLPATTTTSAAEAAAHVRTQGYQTATNTLRDMGIIEHNGNTLTIGRGTAVQSVITRTPDGQITPQSELAGTLPLLPVDEPQRTRFDALHQALKRRAKNAVLRDLIIHLEIPTEPEDSDNDSTHHLLKHPTVKKEISRTATRAVKDLFPQTTHQDHALRVYTTLHQFIGNPTLKQVTKIAGQAATIHDLSTFLKHRRKITTAARSHPNEVILWMTIQPSIAKIPPPSSANDIIDKAKAAFLHDCTNTMLPYRNILRDIPATTAQHTSNQPTSQEETLEQLWHIFTNLDTDALGRSANKTLHRITTLCKTIAAAETRPSPEAVHHLLENPQIPLETHSLLLNLYLRASASRPAEEQATLAFQFEALYRYNDLHTSKRKAGAFNPRELIQALSQRNPNRATNWQQLMALAPQWLRDAQGTAHDRKLLPNPKYMLQTHVTAEKAAAGPLGDDLRLLHEESITAHTIPGKATALFTTNPDRPILLVTKKPDGTIHMDHHTLAMLQIHPGTAYVQTDDNHRKQLPSPCNKEFNYRQTNIAHFHSLFTLNSTWAYLIPRWEQVSGHTNTTQPGFHHDINLVATKTLHYATHKLPDPSELVHSITQGVQSMVDTTTWDRANPGQIPRTTTTLFLYNAAATLGEKLDQLFHTNPGAITWILERARTTDPINHPGQLITLARESLLNAGLDPRNWKFAATLDAPLMRVLAANTNAARSTHILNNLAQANAKPAPSILSLMTAFWVPTDKHNTPNQARIKTNTGLLIRLLARESATLLQQDPTNTNQVVLCSQIHDVMDFVHAASNQDIPLESSTWRGLTRRALQWHRQSAKESATRRWQQALQQRGGSYMAWDSVLDIVQIGQHTVTPLTNEKLLHEESAAMGHCVYSYTDRCTNGRSRIFSVSNDGKKLATAEIVRTGSTWKPTQTRAHGNHDAPDEIHSVMTQVALDYTQHSKTKNTVPPWRVQDPTAELTLDTA